jgi:hypothetical protein
MLVDIATGASETEAIEADVPTATRTMSAEQVT